MIRRVALSQVSIGFFGGDSPNYEALRDFPLPFRVALSKNRLQRIF